MITDLDINRTQLQEIGIPLVWVIDQDCLYDLPLNIEYADLFLNSDTIEDVSDLYPDNVGITVRFYKNNEPVEDFNTNEYFGSILLSPHLVINLNNHAYGYYVVSPNAKFINNEFVILDQDTTYLEKFKFPNTEECTPINCQCYKEINV